MSYSGGPLPKGVTLENLHLFLPHTRGTVGHSPITPANPEAVMVITDSAGPPEAGRCWEVQVLLLWDRPGH